MQLVKNILVLSLLLVAASAPAADRFVSTHGGETDGSRIYVRNCAKCHEFYPPSNYSQVEWDKWMVKMRRKSKLKSTDFDKVQQYTQQLRNGEAEAPKKK